MAENNRENIRSVDEAEKPAKRKRMKLKVPRRYRLSFVNEGTLNSVWTIGMSRTRMRIYIALIVVALVMLGSFIISFTPLRTLLPGYLRKGERREYIEASERLDSIVEKSTVMEAYITNINDIMTDNIDIDSLKRAPHLLTLSNEDSLVGPTSAEAAYVEQYLARENFNIDARMAAADSPLMVAPVDGAVVAQGSKPSSTIITLPRQSRLPVKAVAQGIVLEAAKTDAGGYNVVVQHPDGFVSRYGRLAECFVKPGQSLEAETRLGVVNATDNRRLDFSLWQGASQVEPTRLIAF
ncbi:MAG: M23 family metallopeptidase [Muribaculaceae bacterium]|nr:M23 family metallopeptidase [Muribaculaceae bacterium]MDE5967997.1 M23 family metallopeptidase [Muribaculaceae bacterium]